jgi:hypothetical protein
MFSVNIFMLVITGLFFDMGVICHKSVNHLCQCFIDFHEITALPPQISSIKCIM